MDPYYLVGDDDDDEDIELLGELEEDPLLGARPALHRRVRGARGIRARRRIAQALVPKTPGVPKPGGRELVLGFPGIQFTNTSALAFNMTARPQMPFKGRRLIVIATRTAAALQAVTVTSLLVGQRNQFVSAQPVPVEAFDNDSYGVDMALDPAVPGTDIVLAVACAANPGVGETIDINACIIGLSIA